MSWTAKDDCPLTTATFDLQLYEEYAYYFREQLIVVGLLAGLHGVLTILSITSAYSLAKRCQRTWQPTTIILCLTILALFASTTVYVVTSILQCQWYFLSTLANGYSLWPASPPVIRPSPESLPGNSGEPVLVSACASAATLTANVVLGDAIVCWRACVIWQKNRAVQAVCGLFLLATLAVGAIDATQSCHSRAFAKNGAGPVVSAGTLFEGLPLGIAACVLSLATNVLATMLVAYKACESRLRLRQYLVAKVGGSRVEKLLSLLVESGAIYSAIWAVVVAYQVGEFKYGFPDVTKVSPISPQSVIEDPPAPETMFLDVVGVLINGTLVPVVAIYPTIIIVLVAINTSHMERGITQHLESIPTPRIGRTIDTNATGLHESCLYYPRSEALIAVDGEESRYEDVSDSEAKHRLTGEEQKVEEIVCDQSFPLV